MPEQRRAAAEANQSGTPAVAGGKHSQRAARRRLLDSSTGGIPRIPRMPTEYTQRDVETLLHALWTMFTESQARRLVVVVPWDSSEEPVQMTVADLATLLERWLA